MKIISGTPSEIREFSLAYEVDKLKKMLGVPITNIVFDEKYEYGKRYLNDDMTLTTIYAKLYVNDDLIGTIPYISDKWGPGYFNNNDDELAWYKIYQQFQQVIFDKIVQQEPLAATVEIKGYKSLHVKDKDGTVIKIAYCNYINDEWNAIVGGLNPVIIRKEVTVSITPPPFNEGEEIKN
jgi:hypothetical protein